MDVLPTVILKKKKKQNMLESIFIEESLQCTK